MTQRTKEQEQEVVQRMIHTHLQRYAMTAPPVFGVEHLDEDALSAFVGGELSEQEAAPLITHLVNCAQCRHTTAELARLQEQFADEPIEIAPASDAQRGRLRRFLDAISASITPDADDRAVFAYHEPETEDEEENNPDHPDTHDERAKER